MCGSCRPARVLLGVARSLHEVDEPTVDDDLGALAACALFARCSGPAAQLETIAGAMEPFALSDAHVGVGDLLVDEVLANWTGTPLLLCVVAAEAGGRAGLDLAVAGDGRDHVVVHRAERAGTVYDPERGLRLLTPAERERFHPRCGHQVAFSVLATIIERATRAGDIGLALRAAELRLRLPLAAPLRARVEAERHGLQAVLN
ncbi:MAG TPA: hypothetical protein VN238_04090 [Solirubrobacteraceae bacterium]|nr:hypothetical protein [Solirubrobacteraceae bacterium]